MTSKETDLEFAVGQLNLTEKRAFNAGDTVGALTSLRRRTSWPLLLFGVMLLVMTTIATAGWIMDVPFQLEAVLFGCYGLIMFGRHAYIRQRLTRAIKSQMQTTIQTRFGKVRG